MKNEWETGEDATFVVVARHAFEHPTIVLDGDTIRVKFSDCSDQAPECKVSVQQFLNDSYSAAVVTSGRPTSLILLAQACDKLSNSLIETAKRILDSQSPVSVPQKQMVGRDMLTGRPIYIDDDDPKATPCPRCGSRSLISDQPSITRCMKCGWNDD